MIDGADGRSERTVRPRRCRVCSHPRRAELEIQKVAGVSLRVLAKNFDLEKTCIMRHFKAHVSEKRRQELMSGPGRLEDLVAAATRENRSAIDYLTTVRSMLFNQFVTACDASDRQGVVMVAAPLLKALKSCAELTGEMVRTAGIQVTNNTINLSSSPMFADLSAGLIEICRQFPDAKTSILELLRRIDRQESSPAIEVPAIAAPAEAAQ